MNGNDRHHAFLLAGGRPRDEAAMERMFRRILGDATHVAYIGAANGDNAAHFEMTRELFTRLGARRVDFLRLASGSVDIDAVKATLAAAGVVFLSGGEVEDGMNRLKAHGLDVFLKELYAAGKRMAGISAGSIMLGAHWVRWDDPEDNSTAALFDCLGIIPATFDTHAEDEDWIELKTALRLMGDGAAGYGIQNGGMISADSGAVFVNLEKTLLTFVNEGGEIRLVQDDER